MGSVKEITKLENTSLSDFKLHTEERKSSVLREVSQVYEQNGKRNKEDAVLAVCHLHGCGGRYGHPFILYDK
nr:hypothetical protein [uncultured Acetatifactor sp.]